MYLEAYLMDYGLANLIVTFALLAITFLYRRRILAALGRLLFTKSIEFIKATYLVESEEEAEDGSKTRKIGLSVQAKAILAALTPILIAEVVKNVKLKVPSGLATLPTGASLEDMAPIALSMLPKRYQGIAALALPFIQSMLPNLGRKREEGKTKTSRTDDEGSIVR